MSSQKAVRTATDGSHTDVIEFLGAPGQQILTTTHLPAADPVAGVVVCSSLRAEFETNYRREILLGRALAASGIATARFQYRGTGNSDGDTSAVTFERMLTDAHAATEAFIGATGLERLAFVGTRLGGTIAAALAAERAGAPVVVWEPVVDAAKYYKQIFRARKMWSVHGEGDEVESGMAIFERAGSIDIVGYPIDRNLYDSVVARDLVTELGDQPHPVLIVQMGGRHGPKREYSTLAATWSAIGNEVAIEVVDEDESWWLEHPGERQEKRTMNSSPAIDTSVEWLRRWVAGTEVAA